MLRNTEAHIVNMKVSMTYILLISQISNFTYFWLPCEHISLLAAVVTPLAVHMILMNMWVWFPRLMD